MTARADAAAQTGRRILEAAAQLFTTRDYEEVTLQSVAEAAGVTLQTVLRRFQSKEQLTNAASEAMQPQMLGSRRVAHPGDIAEAVRTLSRSYEAVAELNWRLLRQAHRFPVLQQILAAARRTHRRWIEETFAPLLPPRGRARQRLILLLFAATDFYQWKLYRYDLGLPAAEVERLLGDVVRALTRKDP